MTTIITKTTQKYFHYPVMDGFHINMFCRFVVPLVDESACCRVRYCKWRLYRVSSRVGIGCRQKGMQLCCAILAQVSHPSLRLRQWSYMTVSCLSPCVPVKDNSSSLWCLPRRFLMHMFFIDRWLFHPYIMMRDK